MGLTSDQQKILTEANSSVRVSIHKDQGASSGRNRCEVVCNVTGEAYCNALGDTEGEAVSAALAKIPTATKPYATKEAKELAEKSKEIEDLKRKLEEVTKKK